MNAGDIFESIRHASRELHLLCDPAGQILLADDRARRILGVTVGTALRDRVTPGCEDKLADFLRRAIEQEVDCCEIPFVVERRAVTVSLCSVPRDRQIVLVGQVVPEAFASAMSHVNEMMSEAVELSRTIVNQRNEIAARNADLMRINAELTESNQGILSLHSELQQKADQSRQENAIKTRMVSNLSHELRTPLHSILGLTQLLDSGLDGAMSPEQAKQVRYIRSSADELLALVNDVLDLGTLDGGHSQVHIERFSLADFLASTRGVLRPLLPAGSSVELVVEDQDGEVETDRTKLAQITRNLVSNAIKFTERGHVRVRAAVHGDRLVLAVEDTGIGIPAEHLDRVFEEYGQVDSPLQRRQKGTGLGLPLSLRLAQRLGGDLRVESEPGRGSTFTLDVPAVHDEARLMEDLLERSQNKPPDAASILVVEDDRHTLFLYERYLVTAGFHVMPARTIEEATKLLAKTRPAAIVLDVMLEGDSSWGFLAELKGDPVTRDIPVLVVTVTNRADKARALGADEFWLKPVDQERLLRKLKEIAKVDPVTRVLVIDDDDTSRYIVRQHLANTPYVVYEASTSEQGVKVAREQHPNVILLDFLLQGSTAFDVIDDLKADPKTRGIPIIIVTSQVLEAVDRERLLAEAEAVISKQHLSRELAINRIRDALRKVRALDQGRP